MDEQPGGTAADPRPEVVREPDPDAAATAAAARIADRLRSRLADHPWACVALSGGRTPVPLFEALADADLPWPRIAVVQVDERVAPDGDGARNLGILQRHLLDHVDAVAHPMDVTDPDLRRAAFRYGRLLRSVAGDPPVIDVVHLGLGDDGHTASLVPGDPVCRVTDRDVAVAGPYAGHRRLTLTAPALNRARQVVWLVTGEEKGDALRGLLAGDPELPATLVRSPEQVIVTDLGIGGG